jgi:hypothetical protein
MEAFHSPKMYEAFSSFVPKTITVEIHKKAEN